MSCPTCCKSIEIVQQLEAENQRLKEACEIFSRYGLPPEDVSGWAEWKRAISILKEVRDE